MITIRDIEEKNIDDVVKVHYECFTDFFLTSLGKSFLKVFYKAIILSKNGIGVAAFEDKRLVGFAVGTTNSTGFYKDILKKNYLKMIWAALPKLIASPASIKRLIDALTASGKNEYVDIPALLSISALPQTNSKGVGSQILAAFETKLQDKGCTELILTTDFYGNDHVNLFYTRNNYTCVQSFLQGPRKMNLYHKKF